MGPVVSKKLLDRILGYVQAGLDEGAKLLLDGRAVQVDGYPVGYFIAPTIFADVTPEMAVAQEEIFGPVLGIIRVPDFEEALDVIHSSPYGNAASIFTSSGKRAREFKYRVRAGNIGINIGIVASIASFPFSGMKDSFFGDLHGQGRDAIQFFTERKVVILRWFKGSRSMQLGTFGAIMGFAIELETQAESFYKQASTAFPQRRLLSQLYRGARKRSGRMERTRREGVAEMILESISGLDSQDYQIELSDCQTLIDWVNQANGQCFYQDAAAKLPIDEVARILSRMASENEWHLTELGQVEV
jgi:acyl-CoA reductase-like NAD-dependent aldehyde dehydrogenase